ncbi:hypothetical protein MMC06_002441 [Schaereria dolodes]|nr:hypothetical protein [Schaereria dolodes]
MKQRFSSLDVKIIAHELSNSLYSLRLANVYDLSSRIFLLKFAKPNRREQLVIDSGFRCHLTKFSRVTAAAPSAFVTRLRKFLRTRRVTSVSQVGTDRIIELQFSDGQYRLFLEFYAGGNIVLTDKEFGILALLRVVGEGQDQEELRVGLKYSIENRQNYGGVPRLTKQRVKECLQKTFEKAAGNEVAPTKKLKRKPGDALRKALSTSLTEFPPVLVDHALRVKEFDLNTPVEEVLKDDALLDKLMTVLGEASRTIIAITSSRTAKGYIFAKRRLLSVEASIATSQVPGHEERNNLIYDDFHPFQPRQFEGSSEIQILEFEGFNTTVDEFFSSIEAQKLESRLTDREENAKKKLEAARQDHQKRLGGLQQVQELNVRKAQAIEVNLQKVQEAIAAVNGLVAQGMDWVEIARLIEMEQVRQNPVAEMIKLPLKLYENAATLLLVEADFEDEEDFEGDETGSEVSVSDDNETSGMARPSKSARSTDKLIAVDVDLALSPWSNARQYYDQKKTAAVKEQKTMQSSSKALKSTERKINADLKKGLKQEKQVLRPIRRQLWFEKFYYFISSDGYLVLGGKDAQQNEILYKRYLRRGDVYVHADLNGAASVIIKNKLFIQDAPIPPSTLSQAGSFSVATSTAWESKAVMSAWWVNTDQVSKIAPSGEYLTVGSFMIRGKKNFLPPAQLLLGFGVMFQISEESKARHLKHRLNDEKSPKTIGEDSAMDIEDNRATTIFNEGNDKTMSDEESYLNDTMSEKSDLEDDRPESELDDESEDLKLGNPLQTNHRPIIVSSKQQQLETPLLEADAIKDDSEEDNKNYDSGAEEAESGQHEKDSQIAKEETSASSTRHISARERRLLRKGQIPDPTDALQLPTADPEADSCSDNPSIGTPPTKNAPQAPRVRGKHGKLAKQKTKYANQDEEDRALALRLLGSAAAVEKSQSDAATKAQGEADLAAQKARRREQHQRTAEAGKEAEEMRRLNMEEGIETLDEDEEAELGLLDCFVGMPLPGDEILDCLVVCGPWDSLGGRCRWRVKIQPGAVKKGKAVREILGKWGADIGEKEKRKGVKEGEEGGEEEKMRRREGGLIRGLREVEIVGVVPVGKCRVVLGGGGDKSRGTGGGGGKSKRGGRGSKKAR